MSTAAAFITPALNTWSSNLETIDSFFADRTDKALDTEIAPGKNRLIYLLGHFAAVHDRMIPLLGLGNRLHPELDALFLSAKDREVAIPPASEIRKSYAAINTALGAAMMALPAEEWLAKHTAVSDEDFAREPHRNRFSVLLSRTSHLWYHYGQMALAPKSA